MIVFEEGMEEALDRIARTSDGHVLYLYFQQVLCGVALGAASDGALREDNGRRRFASQLMGLMAKGIEESGGSNASGRPVVFSRRQPDADKRHVSAREYFRRQQQSADADGGDAT